MATYDERLNAIEKRINQALLAASFMKQGDEQVLRIDIDFERETHLTVPARDALDKAIESYARAEIDVEGVKAAWLVYRDACRVAVRDGRPLYEPTTQEFNDYYVPTFSATPGERVHPLLAPPAENVRQRTLTEARPQKSAQEASTPLFAQPAEKTAEDAAKPVAATDNAEHETSVGDESGAEPAQSAPVLTESAANSVDPDRISAEESRRVLDMRARAQAAAERLDYRLTHALTDEQTDAAEAAGKIPHKPADALSSGLIIAPSTGAQPAVTLNTMVLLDDAVPADAEVLATAVEEEESQAALEAALLDDDGSDEPEAEQQQEAQSALFDFKIEKVEIPPIYSDEQMIDAAFEFHRKQGFPYRELPPAMCMAAINRLSQMQGKALIHTPEAYMVADVFHPHRFHAHATGKISPKQAFDDDRRLKRAIGLELKMGGKPRVYAGGMLTLVLGTQACSNFRPGFACYLYREFAPDNAVVLDTSTGYGGRLVGAIASRKVARYIGIDPNVQTHEANLVMAETLGFRDMIQLYNLPAEDCFDIFQQDNIVEACDFAFTSPPYFSKEQYSKAETQSWVRYKTGEAWKNKFLRRMLELQFTALKSGAFTVVNIAAINLKGQRYELDKWTIECAETAGFRYVRTEHFPMVSRFGANQDEGVALEPVLIFQKP